MIGDALRFGEHFQHDEGLHKHVQPLTFFMWSTKPT